MVEVDDILKNTPGSITHGREPGEERDRFFHVCFLFFFFLFFSSFLWKKRRKRHKTVLKVHKELSVAGMIVKKLVSWLV